MRGSAGAARFAAAPVALVVPVGPAAAHVGGLSGVAEPGPVPLWLVIVTGGVVVGASFLFSTFLTDHAAMRAVAGWRVRLAVPTRAGTRVTWLVRLASVAGLGLVVAAGLLGPTQPLRNAAILVVWAGWWAGFTMSVYLVGDTWPAVNPWAALARLWSARPRWDYPERLGAWPAVVGLLGLVWLEVVSPVAEDAGLLVGVVGAYTAVTLAGVAAVGAGAWFTSVDPVARVFRTYGGLAPVHRTDDGLEFALPSARLVRQAAPAEPGATAFVVALLWVTTFDGLVSTPAWRGAIEPAVAAGIPVRFVYLAAVVLGFLAFHRAYVAASRWSRETASTYVAAGYLRRWFAPSLVPIAAGYHLAHFLGYFLSLAPVVVAVAASPLDPPAVAPLAMPAWFGDLQLLFVLGGHLVAVWVAHARSFELFPGVLAPIRSQYPLVAAMVFYTVTSLWVVAQPFVQPPYV